MEQKLTKKYGLFTAIAMVVGIVIGSGVFFKAQTILEKTGGLLMPSIIAWIFGGLIMVFCATAFAIMATKYERVGGVVDYAEALVGKNYAFYVGWFIGTVYLPAMTGVLAWVSARYTIVFLNSVIPAWAENPVNPIMSHECMVITFVYMVLTYVLNTLSPKLAGKYQIATTVIKLIPLLLLGIVGVIAGLFSGNLTQNFVYVPETSESVMTLFFAGIVSTAFAYEGWIIATSINAEIKNAKKNLPIALTVGTLIVMAICVLYNLGFAGAAPMGDLLKEGASLAFANLFGSKIGAVLNLFVAISCLGTLNGLMLACTRSAYSLAAHGRGPRVGMFVQIDSVTNMPTNSSILGLFFVLFWFFYFYAGNLVGWFGPYGFDSSELPIITVYAMYLPIYAAFMIKGKGFGFFRRFVIPFFATCGSIFTVYAAIVSHKMGVVYYLIVFALFMLAGWLFDRNNKK